jgi:hypothetical protein
MTADAPHFAPPRSAGTPEPGHDLKSALMPELEEERTKDSGLTETRTGG